MKIEPPEPDAPFYRERQRDLENLLRQPTAAQARPCPDCDVPCPCCGSPSCTCGCSSDCAEAPRQLSVEPDLYPIEAAILPLVYALSALRVCKPCWSCEGHYDAAGKLYKLPRVWFFARSITIPDVIAEHLARLRSERRLAYPWMVSVVPRGDSLDTAYSIEPKLGPDSDPNLARLHHDVRTIADDMREKIEPITRRRIGELDAAARSSR